MKIYQLFDHTADIGVEIYGRTRKELFANAAKALSDMMIERKEKVADKYDVFREEKITLEGSDTADLLVNFLRELLYFHNGKNLVCRFCAILSCTRQKLTTRLIFEPFQPKKHLVKIEVKAVTYHGLSVEKNKAGWKARVIFDV